MEKSARQAPTNPALRHCPRCHGGRLTQRRIFEPLTGHVLLMWYCNNAPVCLYSAEDDPPDQLALFDDRTARGQSGDSATLQTPFDPR